MSRRSVSRRRRHKKAREMFRSGRLFDHDIMRVDRDHATLHTVGRDFPGRKPWPKHIENDRAVNFIVTTEPRKLLLCFASLAAAQSIEADPPYDQPGAQYIAQSRWGYAFIGIAPAPVGWACEWQQQDGFPYAASVVVCEPDPVMLDEDYAEQVLWLQRMIEIVQRFRRGQL